MIINILKMEEVLCLQRKIILTRKQLSSVECDGVIIVVALS